MRSAIGKPAIVIVGIASPHALLVTIEADDSALDLTTVTSVTLNVQRSDSSTVVWATTIQSVTSPSAPGGSQIVVSHVYAADGSDCPVIGQYQIQPSLVMSSGGTAQAYAQTLFVVSQYNTL